MPNDTKATLRVALALFAAVALSKAGVMPSSTQAYIDRSTPIAGYKTLLGAIERNDVETVVDSVLLPAELHGADRQLYGQRVIAASKLMWAVSDKFGKKTASELRAYYAHGAVPRRDPDHLTFEVPRPYSQGRDGIQFTSLTTPMTRNEIAIGMGQVRAGWELNGSGGSANMLEFELADAPWRNSKMVHVLADLNAGKVTDAQSLIADLVPEMKSIPADVGSTDKSNLANIPAAIQAAIDAGDVDAYEDCFIQIDGKKPERVRIDAEIEIDSQKLNTALHKKYGQQVGDELARSGMIVRDPHIYPPTIQMFDGYVWNIDGDIARGLPPHYLRYGDFKRLRRDNGVWRIEVPAGRLDDREKKWEADRSKDIHDRIARVLAHLDQYPNAGSVREDLDPLRAQSHKDEKKHQMETDEWRRGFVEALKKHDKEATTQRALMSPQERSSDELQTSFLKQMFVDPKSTTQPSMYFAAENDPSGAYVRARGHLETAAQQVSEAGNQQMFLGTSGLAYQFGLNNELQNMETFQSLHWVFNGNHAIGTPPEGFSQIHLKMLKVGDEWKIDITDETKGDPANGAAVAEDEAKALEKIADEIKSKMLKNDDAAQAAIKQAQARATGEAR